jgi:hypothetical protein
MQRENKMELLHGLASLRTMGVQLTFEPSMDTPLWKLKHEYEQHDAQQQLMTRVSIVKKGIKMTTLLLSTFAGSFLKLEGWSDYVHRELDTGIYDIALEQIYRTIAGRGRPNCWVQIVMLVVGTAIAYHIHNMTQESGAASNGDNIVLKIFSAAGKFADVFKGSSGAPAATAARRKPAVTAAASTAPSSAESAAPAAAAAEGTSSDSAAPATDTPSTAQQKRRHFPRRPDREAAS